MNRPTSIVRRFAVAALGLAIGTPVLVTGAAVAAHPADTSTVRQLERVSAASGTLTGTGAIRVGADLPVSAQAFAPFAGSGAWRLDPGVAMQCTVDLPTGLRNARLEIQELGWLGNPSDHAFDVLVGGQTIELATSPGRALVTHVVDAAFTAGTNQILIANNRDGGRVGIVTITVTYDRPLPVGTTALAADDNAGSELSVVLRSPRVGQAFDRTTGIPIQWEARGFPPGTGVAIHWRRGKGPWTLIEDARNLPYNHPSGTGTRGHYLWQPAPALGALEDVSFALAYEPRARRDPMQLAVGGEGGLATIGEALQLARDGDTITLAPGEYTESLTIPVSLTIRGTDMARTIIVGNSFVGLTVPADITLALADVTIDCGPAKRRDRVPTAIGVRGTLEGADVLIRNASVGVKVLQGGSARFERLRVETTNVGLEANGGRLAARGLTMIGGELGGRSDGAGAMLELVNSSITGVTTGLTAASGTVQMRQTTLTGIDAGRDPAQMARTNGAYAAGGGTLLLTDCTIADFGRIGVGGTGERTTVRVSGGTVRGIAWNGISVGNKATVEIRGVTVEGCGRFGIAVRATPGVIIRDCVIRNNRGSSVLVEFSPGSDVGGNQSYGNRDDAIRVP